MDLVDALSSNTTACSVVELSLSPLCRSRNNKKYFYPYVPEEIVVKK
jgi:hypothetical protein